MAGEPRYTTTLIGMDGKPRTATVAAKKAENEFLAWGRAIAEVHRHDVEEREQSFEAYRTRLQTTREMTRAQEAERDAIDRQTRRREAEERQANKEAASGEVWLRVYEDLGPVWTRRWLKEELGAHVPDIVHAELSSALTCKALRRGLEALQERRKRHQAVRDPVALVVEIAARWQKSKPTLRMKAEDALRLPRERLAPSR